MENEQARHWLRRERSLRGTNIGRRMLQPARHPRIHGLATVLVVVVLGRNADGADAIGGIEQVVNRAHRRILDFQRFSCPVTGCRTISSGRGAITAAISTLVVSSRRPGGFSQRHPPCMWSEIMLTGAATAMRGSTAAARNVCVPPPDSPVIPIASFRTYGSASRKSIARMLFQSWRPDRLRPNMFARSTERVRHLLTVVVAHHVVGEDDEALTCQVDGPARAGIQQGVFRTGHTPNGHAATGSRETDRRRSADRDYR